jgi:hypothetical protein
MPNLNDATPAPVPNSNDAQQEYSSEANPQAARAEFLLQRDRSDALTASEKRARTSVE